MFLRRKKTPNSPRQSLQIVEGYRDKTGKVKQRIVRHVGIFADAHEEAKLVVLAQEIMDKLEREKAALSPQLSLFDDLQAPRKGRPKRKSLSDILPVCDVKLSDVVEDKRIIDGVHDVAGHVYIQMGFDQILANKKDQTILKDMVMARMVAPNSKRGLVEFLAKQFDITHDLDAVYRMMDKLHDLIPKIKEIAFQNTLSLIPNKQVSLVFFDVTTLYFESIETDDLRAFGYSKDHRFNTTQLVLALATNDDGLPLGYELFPGNCAEVKTLTAALDSWKSFMTIKDVYIVADRAMFSKDNLKMLDESGYRYIVAAKLKTLKQDFQQKILDEANYHPTVLGDELTWIAQFNLDGKRLITSYKAKRALKDQGNRQVILDKITKTLGKKANTHKLITNNGVKKYTSSQGGTTHLDEGKIQEDAQWDGLHGIITNDHTIDAKQAIATYARLWVIEQAFRINKHTLQMRPIFHWTPKRIQTHIAMCYMTFSLLKHMEYRVALTQKISINNIIDALMSVQSSILKHTKTGDLYRLPSALSHEARKIYKAFHLKRGESAEIYQT